MKCNHIVSISFSVSIPKAIPGFCHLKLKAFIMSYNQPYKVVQHYLKNIRAIKHIPVPGAAGNLKHLDWRGSNKRMTRRPGVTLSAVSLGETPCVNTLQIFRRN